MGRWVFFYYYFLISNGDLLKKKSYIMFTMVNTTKPKRDRRDLYTSVKRGSKMFFRCTSMVIPLGEFYLVYEILLCGFGLVQLEVLTSQSRSENRFGRS